MQGDDIVVAADGLVQAIGGSITLQAGDDLADVQGSLLTGGTLFVSVDHRNADRDIGGKAMLGRATIQAAIVRLRGDDDDDVLDAGGIPIPVVARGFAGKDTITGGSQADELYGDDGADTIAGLCGDDLLVAGRGVGDSLSGGDGADMIYGSPDGADADPNFNDLVRFGDVIDGGAGNDRIWGQGGADAIFGSTGDDWIDAGAGNDFVQGGAGSDTIFGHLGNDLIYGFQIVPELEFLPGPVDDAVRDVLWGEWGDDTIVGGAGSDLIDGGFGNDTIFGMAGDDIIRTGYGANSASGGDGDDQIHGSDDGTDVIGGDAGDDRIQGYGGTDFLDGGTGDDIIDGGAGDEAIGGGLGSDVLIGGAGHDLLFGTSALTNAPEDNAVDWLYGDFGTGKNEPGSGGDRLDGEGGNDLLFGEGGDDFIAGTQGFNQYETGGGTSNVIDFGGNGDDSGYVTPTATPAPAAVPVDYTLDRAAASLPDGAAQRGRWGDLGGAAAGTGLSGPLGLGTDAAVAVAADGLRYVAWTDTRSGNPQVFVAMTTADGRWTELLGSASGTALGAGVSRGVTAASAPTITLDATGAPVVAWTADHAGGRDIRVARYDAAAGGWTALSGSHAAGGISGTGTARLAKIVTTSAGPAVAWLDTVPNIPDAARVYVRRFDGTAWVEVGAGSATGNGLLGGATGDDLAIASDGTRIAVAWSARANGASHIRLRQFVGTTWRELDGSATGSGVSGAADAWLDGKVDCNAQPTLAYHDGRLFVAWQAFSDQGQTLAVGSYPATSSFNTSSALKYANVFTDPGLPSSRPPRTCGRPWRSCRGRGSPARRSGSPARRASCGRPRRWRRRGSWPWPRSRWPRGPTPRPAAPPRSRRRRTAARKSWSAPFSA
ncbi:MAG: calcium-binding protein, partial [Planctomycetia bacterium]